MSAPDPPPAAPGWDAIDRACTAHYPGREPHQFTSRRPYELDAPHPLPAITVWESRAPPSWHYVSYGLSELFEKTSPIPDVSGFGIELTVRIRRDPDAEPVPPAWPLILLSELGRHVLVTRRGFDSGHCVELERCPDPALPGSAITALALVPDPALGRIATPFGSLLFLRAVGVSRVERALLATLDLAHFVGLVAELEPSGLLDPARPCASADPERAKLLRRYELGIALD